MPATTQKSIVSDENYTFLQRYVHEESGIVLDNDKHYLLEARLSPILQERNVSSIDSLCSLLRAITDPGLGRVVVEAMTTNETFFFRDSAFFDAIRKGVLPGLLEAKAKTRSIGIWSAAASTGQEIYSIAMLLQEAGLQDWRLKLLATDISEQVLAKARDGKYLQIEVNRGLPAPYLIRYFDRIGLEWQVKPEIRKMVRFEQIDLRSNLTRLGVFDLVFCRNVLIYFNVKTREAVLNQIARLMPSGAYLALGAAETLLNLKCPFVRAPVGQTIMYKRQ